MPEVSTIRYYDGSWGWVVCFACFMAHALTDGITYSFGILFVELLEYYNEGKGNTAFTASLYYGVCMLSGPLNAAISNRFGDRKVVIAGSCLMVTCFIASIFAPNIYYLFVTFGFAGWGYGMVILPSLVCLTKYFDKKRAFAVGLGVSGSGIGTFAASLLTQALVDAYTWKGALLIQSGLILNCIACGLVYLPLTHPMNIDSCTKLQRSRKTRRFELTESSEHTPLVDNAGQYVSYSKVYSETKPSVDSPLVDNAEHNIGNSEENSEIGGRSNGYCALSRHVETETTDQLDESLPATPSNRNTWDILSDTVSVIFSFSNEYERGGATCTDQSKPRVTNTGACEESVLMETKSSRCKLFTNRRLVLYVVASFFTGLGSFVPYVYLPVKAEHSGIHGYAWLVSTIGVSNTVGRVGFGFISDKQCVNRLTLFNTALVLCGAGTILCPFFESFDALVGYAAFYGLFSGVIISLTTVIITDFVGTDLLAVAFGARNFFLGTATLMGTPFAGWLFDITKSYTWTFVAAGLSLMVAGALMFVVPFIKIQRPGQY